MFLLFTLIGFLPFVFGGIMNWFMMTYQNVLPPYMFISVGTLLFWFATVYFTRPYATSAKQLLCGIHLVPFVVIVMLFMIAVYYIAGVASALGLSLYVACFISDFY